MLYNSEKTLKSNFVGRNEERIGPMRTGMSHKRVQEGPTRQQKIGVLPIISTMVKRELEKN